MRELRVGDAVKVLRNTYYTEGDPDFAHVIGKRCEIRSVYYGDDMIGVFLPDKSDWWWFKNSDLELINEGETTVGKRTFKLLKDMPGVKKDTLFQEECEDGTQPYSVLGADQYDQLVRYKDRDIVENNPNWFVEVFKITPEYAAKEELEQWEAFRKGKTPKANKPTSDMKELPDSIKRFIKAYKTNGKSVVKATEACNISRASGYTYLSIARKAGVKL